MYTVTTSQTEACHTIGFAEKRVFDNYLDLAKNKKEVVVNNEAEEKLRDRFTFWIENEKQEAFVNAYHEAIKAMNGMVQAAHRLKPNDALIYDGGSTEMRKVFRVEFNHGAPVEFKESVDILKAIIREKWS